VARNPLRTPVIVAVGNASLRWALARNERPENRHRSVSTRTQQPRAQRRREATLFWSAADVSAGRVVNTATGSSSIPQPLIYLLTGHAVKVHGIRCRFRIPIPISFDINGVVAHNARTSRLWPLGMPMCVWPRSAERSVRLDGLITDHSLTHCATWHERIVLVRRESSYETSTSISTRQWSLGPLGLYLPPVHAQGQAALEGEA
jgi:hypothetical protein